MSIRKIMIGLMTLFLCIIIGMYVFDNKNQNLSGQIEQNILEKTWEQLSAGEQNEVANGILDGSVELYLVTDDAESRFPQMNLQEKYYGQEVYIVTFLSVNRDFLGDIIKVVDKEGLVIGYNLRA